MEELVLVGLGGIKGKDVVVIINRPQVMNALNSEVLFELERAFEKISLNKELRVVILRGAPSGKDNRYPSAFAGADLSTLVKKIDGQYSPLSFDEAKEHMEEGLKVFEAINRLKKERRYPLVVIGAVCGPVLAGGLELLLNICDFIVASESSFFAMPEYNLGGLGGWGGPERLAKLLNNEQRLKYLLLGHQIDAETAERWGVITRVVREEIFFSTAIEISQNICAKNLRATLYNLSLAEIPSTENRTDFATMAMAHLMTGEAWVKSVENFLEKKKK